MNNPLQILDLLSNPQEAKRQVNDFARNFQGNPEEKVRELLNSGKMTQEQYNQLSKYANMLMKFM